MELTEKEFQCKFVSYLKSNGWKVREQVRSEDNKRADVIAYRPDVDIYIGFELKVISGTFTYTKALRQVIGYQKKTFKNITPSIWCIVTPEKELDDSWIITRFMWRFGVGMCHFPDRTTFITYMNAKKKDTIFLQTPDVTDLYKGYCNTPEKISDLVKRIKKDYVIWNE